MLDVLNSAVKNVEMNETTAVDCWDEDIRMIIEFDSMTCLFVENSIDLKIDHFADSLFEIWTKNVSSRFLLI